jgi:hypothetical protein
MCGGQIYVKQRDYQINLTTTEERRMLPGVYRAVKKNGQEYYRASTTFHGKHISLGSYAEERAANEAYSLCVELLSSSCAWTIDDYPPDCVLPFDKWVVLINYRDNRIYFKNPIYLKKRYFLYYIDRSTCLKFDVDDLFYYANHKIMKRGGHYFVSDYGMQVNIASRYGIKNFAVLGRDYRFINGEDKDYSYHNIEIINHYHGVTKVFRKGNPLYLAKIHINGDYVIGRYQTETEAAIAYNKAALILNNNGLSKKFPQNFIEGINEITYAAIFQKLRISKKFLVYAEAISMEY